MTLLAGVARKLASSRIFPVAIMAGTSGFSLLPASEAVPREIEQRLVVGGQGFFTIALDGGRVLTFYYAVGSRTHPEWGIHCAVAAYRIDEG